MKKAGSGTIPSTTTPRQTPRVVTARPKALVTPRVNAYSKDKDNGIPRTFSHPQTPTTPHSPTTPHFEDAAVPDGQLDQTLSALRQENKKLLNQRMAMSQKMALLEEKARADAKKIQALELVLQREGTSSLAGGGRVDSSNKYMAQIDALTSKIYKLEERNQALTEEITSLKSDIRNKKKDHEAKIKELQLKLNFDLRTMEQQQREFATGLKKETRKDVDGLKQHLVVQETDLMKKHMREIQDLKADQLEKELKLKQIIHRLQDELEHYKQSKKRSAIRRVDSESWIGGDDESTGDKEEEGGEEEDPDECY